MALTVKDQKLAKDISQMIIRPLRATYHPERDLDQSVNMDDIPFISSYFDIPNRGAKIIKAVLWRPYTLQLNKDTPVIVCSHGNAENKKNSREMAYLMRKEQIAIVGFDFTGCGNSSGQYVTMGKNELPDLEDVIENIKTKFGFQKIALYGRSMGGGVSVMYAGKHPNDIVGIGCDAPFGSFDDFLENYVRLVSHKINENLVLKVWELVQEKIGIEKGEIIPIRDAQNAKAPLFIGHGESDNLVPISHSEKIIAAYGGQEKHLLRFKGDHNSKRPQDFYDQLSAFYKKILL
ncbi:MAG: putative alpha/beta hydrolase family protein [Streblomastix strix]|uniref:Putative alpha/beta hydrolase family protein n=1 Tax=Streblomastix strix TaxID=222440 RepID=A0A5J4W3M9_9EUKA|nr:MAG: putative alpha/beta hydrolase family protein [Streblomastix strix]